MKEYFKNLDSKKEFIKSVSIDKGQESISERQFYNILKLIKNQPVCDEIGYKYSLRNTDLAWVKVEMTEQEKQDQLELLAIKANSEGEIL